MDGSFKVVKKKKKMKREGNEVEEEQPRRFKGKRNFNKSGKREGKSPRNSQPRKKFKALAPEIVEEEKKEEKPVAKPKPVVKVLKKDKLVVTNPWTKKLTMRDIAKREFKKETIIEENEEEEENEVQSTEEEIIIGEKINEENTNEKIEVEEEEGEEVNPLTTMDTSLNLDIKESQLLTQEAI